MIHIVKIPSELELVKGLQN